MRIGYSDDEDYPGQHNLWQANCDRSIKGRKGQAALQQLLTALEAMPVKRLERDVLVEPSGAMCALGAAIVHKKMADGLSREEAIAVAADIDPDYSDEVGERFGFPRLVAWKIVALNDVETDGRYVTAEGPTAYPYGYENRGVRLWVEFTPEERYERVVAWVREQLREPQRPAAPEERPK